MAFADKTLLEVRAYSRPCEQPLPTREVPTTPGTTCSLCPRQGPHLYLPCRSCSLLSVRRGPSEGPRPVSLREAAAVTWASGQGRV